jgi:hypothetical protein
MSENVISDTMGRITRDDTVFHGPTTEIQQPIPSFYVKLTVTNINLPAPSLVARQYQNALSGSKKRNNSIMVAYFVEEVA